MSDYKYKIGDLVRGNASNSLYTIIGYRYVEDEKENDSKSYWCLVLESIPNGGIGRVVWNYELSLRKVKDENDRTGWDDLITNV